MQLQGASFGRGQGKEGVELAFEFLVNSGLLDLLPIKKYSDLKFDKNIDFIDEYIKKLADVCYEARLTDEFVLTLGGDHTVGLGSVAGILRAKPNTSVFWIDSHGDYNDMSSSITGNFHGMPLNALVNGKKTFNNSLFEWLGDGLIKPENVSIIGLNDVDPKEKELLDQSGINLYWAEDIVNDGIESVVSSALEKTKGDDIHLSFDLDAIRNSEFSATGCYCPNGMSLTSANYIIRHLKETNRLKSMDLVEFNPLLDFGLNQYKIVFDLLRNLV